MVRERVEGETPDWGFRDEQGGVLQKMGWKSIVPQGLFLKSKKNQAFGLYAGRLENKSRL